MNPAAVGRCREGGQQETNLSLSQSHKKAKEQAADVAEGERTVSG